MQEFKIGEAKKLCFLVKKGTAKNIVVPFDSLADIDKKRFFDMEKQGGELMRVMRDTTLDNGVNALVMYADLLVDVDVPKATKVTEAPTKEEETVTTTEEDKPVRKGRGRPKGSKNKS